MLASTRTGTQKLDAADKVSQSKQIGIFRTPISYYDYYNLLPHQGLKAYNLLI